MYAENAVLTKSRALFARRLTKKNYTEMLQCNTVHEVASYLKGKTPYGADLEGVNISSIHRGWLEANLKKILFDRFDALSHYDYALGDKFYHYYIVVGEVTQLIRCVTLMSSGEKEKYLLTLPEFFNSRTSLDLVQLGKASTFSEFMEAVEHTPYHEICEKFIKKDTQSINLIDFSKALDDYCFSVFVETINNVAHGKSREELMNLAKLEIDVYNIEKLTRLSRFRENSLAYITTSSILSGGSLSDDVLQKLMQVRDIKEAVKVLKTTKYGKYLKEEYDYIELATSDIRYAISIHQMRFSTFPRVVMFCYTNLVDLEIQNIIHIIEGIRYRERPEEIMKLLVGIQ